MQYTENYSMNKPQFGDNALVTKLNENADTLDTLIYNTRQMQADSYDSTQTYNTGDLVSYNSALYICLADNVTGTWDSTKWSATTLAEQVELAKQMGGESALADLDDVEITNPSTGQALLFDDDDDVWKNQNLPDVSVTKEASGNPIEITDGASAPVVKCVTEIQGSQDLHGYDKPWVGGAGKNKLPMTVDGIKALNTSGTWTGNVYAIANTTFTIETDNGGNVISIVVNGTTDSDFQQLEIPISNSLFGTEIIMSKGYNLNDVVVGVTQNGSTKIICLTTEVTGTIPDTGTISCYVRLVANRSANNVKIYPMIRLSTVTDSTFEPYSNICPITAYTEGEIEVGGKYAVDYVTQTKSMSGVTGVLQPDGKIVLNGNGSVNNIIFWNIDDSSTTISRQCNGKKALSNGTYILKGSVENKYRIQVFGSNVANAGSDDAHIIFLGNGKVTIDNTYAYNWIRIMFYGGVQFENEVIDPVFIKIEDTHTTTYPSAIYRGSEDVVNGTVGANSDGEMWVVKQLDGTEGFTLSAGTSVNPRRFIKSVSALGWPAADDYAVADAISDNFHYESSNIYNKFGTFRITTSLVFPDSEEVFADATEFNQWLADNHPQIAYKLQTPTTSSVTPTNLPIRTLSGYNHIESSTGDMEIEYITENYQPLVDLIQSSKHVYSTQEQIVGTWVDGSITYERTIYISGTLVMESPNTWIDSGVDISYIDRFVSFNAIMVDGYGAPALWGGKSNNHLMLLTSRGNTFNGLYVTIRYTKPNATRSLNTPLTSQKAQIEPLTAKEEETPTEEEKAVNEEENNDETR